MYNRKKGKVTKQITLLDKNCVQRNHQIWYIKKKVFENS